MDEVGMVAAVLDALDECLTRHGSSRRINLVISDRLLRYALLPWYDDVLSEQEDHLLCRARLEAIYGDMTGWHIQADRRQYGQARFTCALPVSLANGIAALCTQHGASRGALLPHFVACWNRWRRHLGSGPGMLIVAECSNLVLGTFGLDGWKGLRSQFAAPSPQGVRDAVWREKMRLGMPADCPVWVADATAGVDLATTGSLLPRAASAPALAMALMAAGI
jgi:hypothetical protein